MSFINNLTTDNDIKESGDSVGMGGLRESAIYEDTITMAYLTESAGGAGAVVLHLKNSDGHEMRETIYVTSGKAKGQKNYYERDGQRVFLPGFELVNNLCLLTTGEELPKVASEAETKLVKVWNSELGAEQPTEMPVLVSLIGQKVYSAVLKVKENKNVKDGNGTYVPTNEAREFNTVDKFFRADDKMTVTEIKAGLSEATFFDTWADKFTGKVRDKFKEVQGAPTQGRPSAPTAAAPTAGNQSLFKKPS